MKCLETVEKVSKDHCTTTATTAVANAELSKQCISSAVKLSTDHKDPFLDICKLLVSKRYRSDDGDTDDDGDAKPPARKKPKCN